MFVISFISQWMKRSKHGLLVFPLKNQPKAMRVCICLINQSNRSISVLLLFLFCSRVFISKLYENRSNSCKTDMLQMSVFLHNSYTSHSLTHSHLTNTSPFTNLRVKEFYLVAVWHPIMTSQSIQTPINNSYAVSTTANTHWCNKSPSVFFRVVALLWNEDKTDFSSLVQL